MYFCQRSIEHQSYLPLHYSTGVELALC